MPHNEKRKQIILMSTINKICQWNYKTTVYNHLKIVNRSYTISYEVTHPSQWSIDFNLLLYVPDTSFYFIVHVETLKTPILHSSLAKIFLFFRSCFTRNIFENTVFQHFNVDMFLLFLFIQSFSGCSAHSTLKSRWTKLTYILLNEVLDF